ncbi:MAG: PfkB family carbohydrate kinase [Parachlamydiales bacterium]|jgi:rfaE bifunctional protein nucleotidyltransferase chain/domain
MSNKIKNFSELKVILEKLKLSGQKIVQCHGVFDLLHPGHIRHFKEAKALGDKLVVSVTPDCYVNKGPGRPAFNEVLRLETLASLSTVDYVVLNDAPDAISAIEKIQPDVYVKGQEYQDHASDITGKIAQEAAAVESFGGSVYYSKDIVFSSSALINKYIMPHPPEVTAFIERVKKSFSLDEIIEQIHSLQSLKATIVGDAILDEYQYVEPLGQTGKGLHMVASLRDKELFLGGSLILANHMAQFVSEVNLVTALGKECPHLEFIRSKLDPKVNLLPVYIEKKPTLVKKRYVFQDGKNLNKLFETYSFSHQMMVDRQSQAVLQQLQKAVSSSDFLLVSDFGNGFINDSMVEEISRQPVFLALNTQTNSGNRGYNMITRYLRADYISLNEPELRLAFHDRDQELSKIVQMLFAKMRCRALSVTRGVNGVLCFDQKEKTLMVPAFVSETVDRIGAGDSYLALSSLCQAKGCSTMITGLIGSLAAALGVQTVGNKEAVQKDKLVKFLTRLMK